MKKLLKFTFSGLGGNELTQVWNIAHHFYVPFLKRVVNSTCSRLFFGVPYKIILV